MYLNFLHVVSAAFLATQLGISAAITNPIIDIELYSDNKCLNRVAIKSSNISVPCARIDDRLGVHGIIPSGPQNFPGGFNTITIFTKPECPMSPDPYVAQNAIFGKCNYLRDGDIAKLHYSRWQMNVHRSPSGADDEVPRTG
ncbi:uncharacterized protein F4822DRAFT_433844 [Hypoxylon trugodes]|uniref:uncharacterized protein n=1 Tax=Hypoxylon trugodes TaxID=326681 RepID=UPI00218DDF45|nr:uncharacterized protein F4822DRAFT_433844 [Hypoxylon trugodes]KAI1383896.1 hypothetical protein F4822DRAFT_433844 [Hypoxylon trugodes]